jgi:hypothetical protein
MPAKRKNQTTDAPSAPAAIINEIPPTSSTLAGPTVSKPSKTFLFLVSAIVLVLFSAAVALAFKNQQLSKQLSSVKSQLSSQGQNSPNGSPLGSSDEVKQLVDAVGKLIILPSDEQPTIATVTDLAKLQGQPFFANAQVGDKVLIYQNAAKAILYRPSTNQVIELAPLNLGSSVSGQLTVEIRNGSGKSGAAAAWKQKLAQDRQASVIKTGN